MNAPAASLRQGPLIPRGGAPARLVFATSAAMTFLAVCALAAALTAEKLAILWTDQLARVATITAEIEAGPETAAQTSALLDALEALPGVAGAHALDEAEIQALLSPWLGPDAPLADLPVPLMIDLETDGAGPDRAAVEAVLAELSPGAVYDDHGRWRDALAGAARTLRALAFGALLIAAGAAAAAVALATNAGLAANTTIIDALLLMGAEDRFIARVFERRFARRALTGALLGLALGALGLWALGDAFKGAATPGGLDLSPTPGDWVTLSLTPLASAAVAWGTTRISVIAALRRRR